MSLRDSIELIQAVKPEAGFKAIETEIMAERASSMGAADAKVKATLAALAAATEADRPVALAASRNAVWAYFVQRELCGFRRHADVIRDLGIPDAVLLGLGVMRR
ncbi:hypothetical protein SAMN02983003_0228 [Devosia enhydra]|uniref:Uncharacterized protein n=1 Tax=Devosia enhydra TaxID=665118 RepID=A0A1K2HSK3_9HYPH|nr:DUF6665 family protein [Devosia enhydra]SFZ80956.1 hypothetical protein SAMN02983003_0228 [Devosia enhydra]